MAAHAKLLLKKALEICRDAEIAEEAYTEVNLADLEHQKFKSGLGLRVNINGRLGYAWSEGELSGLDILKNAARSAASGKKGSFSQKGIFTSINPESAAQVSSRLTQSITKMQSLIQNLDFMLPSMLPKRRFSLSARILQHTLKLTIRAGEKCADRIMHILTLNSEDGIPVGDTVCTSADLDSASNILCRLVWRAIHSQEAAWPENQVLTGVFTPSASARLIEDFAQDVLNINSDYDLPKDKDYQWISPEITLTENSAESQGFGAVPFDGEGAAKVPVALIDKGRLISPLYDLSAAKNNSLPPSCLSVRSWGEPPKPGYSNLILNPGKFSMGQLCAKAGFGILLDRLTPLPQHMKKAGEFARRCETAFIIQHGRPVCRIPQLIVRGKYSDIFGSNLLGIGYEPAWSGRTFASALAVKKLNFEEQEIDSSETGSDYPQLWW